MGAGQGPAATAAVKTKTPRSTLGVWAGVYRTVLVLCRYCLHLLPAVHALHLDACGALLAGHISSCLFAASMPTLYGFCMIPAVPGACGVLRDVGLRSLAPFAIHYC